ncbi:MAG: hypothetical protein PHE33_00250 [Bacteroidales bacterium]|nr:hypothetical protein [Bacteroidales bacterium]
MKYFIIGLSFIISIVIFTACDDDINYEGKVSCDKISLNDSIRIRKIQFYNENVGLLCGGTKNTNGSIYITNDGGNSWTKTFQSDSLSVNSFFYLNDSVVFACGDSLMLLKSKNLGHDWSIIELDNYPYLDYYLPYHDIYATSEDNIFLVGGEHFNKGLWSETETGNYPWTHDSYDNEFASLCFVTEHVGFIGGYGIMMVTEDGGNTFDHIDFENEFFVDMETDGDGNVYAVSNRGILYYSSDLGYNWSSLIDDYNAEFTDLFLGKEVSSVCGLNGLVYIKNLGNSNWLKINDIPKLNYYSVCVSYKNEIFLGANEGEIYVLNKKRTI